MTKKYQTARQRPRSLYIEFDLADLPTGTFVSAFELPSGAVIQHGSLRVLTAGNGGTSETISLGTSGAATSLASAVDAKTAARTALTVLKDPLTANTTYGFTRTEGGTAATTGKYAVDLTYLIAGSSDFTQG